MFHSDLSNFKSNANNQSGSHITPLSQTLEKLFTSLMKFKRFIQNTLPFQNFVPSLGVLLTLRSLSLLWITCAMLSADVVVHALDNSWELHKPYLQKSWLLSSMLKKAQMTGMRNIEEEDEEDSTSRGGEIGMKRIT